MAEDDTTFGEREDKQDLSTLVRGEPHGELKLDPTNERRIVAHYGAAPSVTLLCDEKYYKSDRYRPKKELGAASVHGDMDYKITKWRQCMTEAALAKEVEVGVMEQQEEKPQVNAVAIARRLLEDEQRRRKTHQQKEELRRQVRNQSRAHVVMRDISTRNLTSHSRGRKRTSSHGPSSPLKLEAAPADTERDGQGIDTRNFSSLSPHRSIRQMQLMFNRMKSPLATTAEEKKDLQSRRLSNKLNSHLGEKVIPDCVHSLKGVELTLMVAHDFGARLGEELARVQDLETVVRKAERKMGPHYDFFTNPFDGSIRIESKDQGPPGKKRPQPSPRGDDSDKKRRRKAYVVPMKIPANWGEIARMGLSKQRAAALKAMMSVQTPEKKVEEKPEEPPPTKRTCPCCTVFGRSRCAPPSGRQTPCSCSCRTRSRPNSASASAARFPQRQRRIRLASGRTSRVSTTEHTKMIIQEYVNAKKLQEGRNCGTVLLFGEKDAPAGDACWSPFRFPRRSLSPRVINASVRSRPSTSKRLERRVSMPEEELVQQ